MNLLRTDEGEIDVSYHIYRLLSTHRIFTGEGARCSFSFSISLHCSFMSKCHLKCGSLKYILPQRKTGLWWKGLFLSARGCRV